jgi:hypothetical protein
MSEPNLPSQSSQRSSVRSSTSIIIKYIVKQRKLHWNSGQKIATLLALEAAVAIMNNDLKILFVDEADLLNVDGFEFLRYIFNKTGCPIVVVGLRQILQVIREYEKFGSRVGPHIEFRPPDEEEVLTKILPQLLVPHWKFDLSSRRQDDKANKNQDSI